INGLLKLLNFHNLDIWLSVTTITPQGNNTGMKNGNNIGGTKKRHKIELEKRSCWYKGCEKKVICFARKRLEMLVAKK
ncbi:hypothetical protein ABTD92_20820, partial [Acinetobacter baumannii]